MTTINFYPTQVFAGASACTGTLTSAPNIFEQHLFSALGTIKGVPASLHEFDSYSEAIDAAEVTRMTRMAFVQGPFFMASASPVNQRDDLVVRIAEKHELTADETAILNATLTKGGDGNAMALFVEQNSSKFSNPQMISAMLQLGIESPRGVISFGLRALLFLKPELFAREHVPQILEFAKGQNGKRLIRDTFIVRPDLFAAEDRPALLGVVQDDEYNWGLKQQLRAHRPDLITLEEAGRDYKKPTDTDTTFDMSNRITQATNVNQLPEAGSKMMYFGIAERPDGSWQLRTSDPDITYVHELFRRDERFVSGGAIDVSKDGAITLLHMNTDPIFESSVVNVRLSYQYDPSWLNGDHEVFLTPMPITGLYHARFFVKALFPDREVII